MYKFGILTGALAALFLAGCGDKDPVSSQEQTDNPSQLPQYRWSYEEWTKGSYARDLNYDGAVDQADFSAFLAEVSPDDTPPDSTTSGKVDPGTAADALQQPALYVAGNPEQAARFINWLNDPELVARIWENDYSTTWVVAAFRGQVPTGGYGITIADIQSDGQSVKLYVNLNDPAPEAMVAQVISYPYQVLFVPKTQAPVPEGATWSMFTSEGKLLAQAGSGIVGPLPPDPNNPAGGIELALHYPKADVRGNLTRLETLSEEGYYGRVLIEGQFEEGLTADKAVLAISANTRIYVVQGDSVVAAGYTALQEGQQVQAVFAGPVLESYPVQGEAAEIVVLK
ncbi:MAG: protease complex subunit PrcB family protein [Candidatus Latescibacteria bacterium]|nr:protease complex subunit PrcB family protein [Candidatus Latescibacterota bacterium]